MIAARIKKAKFTKKCVIKRKIKFEDYKNCLKATKLENRVNQPRKNKVNIDSIREKHKRIYIYNG